MYPICLVAMLQNVMRWLKALEHRSNPFQLNQQISWTTDDPHRDLWMPAYKCLVETALAPLMSLWMDEDLQIVHHHHHHHLHYHHYNRTAQNRTEQNSENTCGVYRRPQDAILCHRYTSECIHFTFPTPLDHFHFHLTSRLISWHQPRLRLITFNAAQTSIVPLREFFFITCHHYSHFKSCCSASIDSRKRKQMYKFNICIECT